MIARRLANGLLSALFEPPCAACHAALTNPLDGAVCDRCWASVRPITPPLCYCCGDPLPSQRASIVSEHRCPRCRRSAPAVDRIVAVGTYDGSLREIVHALKYGGRRSIAPRLSALMRAAGADLIAGADFAVPVPLHFQREWRRGFNQAEDLARWLGLPLSRTLRRIVATAPQVGLLAEQRRRNVGDAFALACSSRWTPGTWRQTGSQGCSGRVILLVDDVTTTGATLDACARVLKRAGAREVRAVTAARVVTGRP